MYWGWGSADEMCEVYFSYIPVNYEDYGQMLAASFASFDHVYPKEERIPTEASNVAALAEQFAQCDVWSVAGQKLMVGLVESRLASSVIAQLEQAKRQYKGDATYTTNLAELRMAESIATLDERKMEAAATEAANTLYPFVEAQVEDWNVYMSYGRVMLESGMAQYEKEGVRALENLLELQEQAPAEAKYAKAYWALGKYYYGQRNDAKAEAVLKRGLKYHPKDADLNQELASDGRIVKKTLN